MMISDHDIVAFKSAQDVAKRVVAKLANGARPQRLWNARDELSIARALHTFLRVTEIQGCAIVEMNDIIAKSSTEAMQIYDKKGNPDS